MLALTVFFFLSLSWNELGYSGELSLSRKYCLGRWTIVSLELVLRVRWIQRIGFDLEFCNFVFIVAWYQIAIWHTEQPTCGFRIRTFIPIPRPIKPWTFCQPLRFYCELVLEYVWIYWSWFDVEFQLLWIPKSCCYSGIGPKLHKATETWIWN